MNSSLDVKIDGYPVYRLIMQNDSNLVLYDRYSNPIWKSNTSRPLGNFPVFIVQNDRNAVIYSYPYSAPLWASGFTGSLINNPHFKLIYEKKNNFFTGASYYIKGVVAGDNQELYNLFNIQI